MALGVAVSFTKGTRLGGEMPTYTFTLGTVVIRGTFLQDQQGEKGTGN